ncbi:beta-ketoacyl-[acyl-carrier-protein] synthase III A, chloroplastic-like isoform X2 [Nicotiana sylvestris]|uniref:beta-ketoacyl-[acyl-carrier-protein] synthase III n=1 Tax=Nicotiana sylvestris TaxID=4096 RepID=A0A1U7Y0J0_NICSY|nr:PREDICTED: 3-oxoacyl-[acyl-carrier-protein] synthase 3 A, chloroplastic-like isoform X2 [Nicotiana sylvestris]
MLQPQVPQNDIESLLKQGLYFMPAVPILRRRFSRIQRVECSFFVGTINNITCSTTSKGADELSLNQSQLSRLVNTGCKLVGCGSAVPSLKVSNDDLAKIVDTNDEWISVRTGIRNRRVLSGKENLTGLAIEASRKALEMAEVNPKDVDLILMCSSTGDDRFGSAPLIQKALGCKSNPLAFDITAACSGFLLGLFSATCYIKAGGFKNVLVIGADAISRCVDWTDRGSCILFGDAAGAVLMQACDIGEDGLFGFDLHSDGDGKRHLIAPFIENETEDGSSTSHSGSGFPPKGSSYSCLKMNGIEIFKFAVRVVPQSIEAALDKAGFTQSDFDWLLLHQANRRIIDAIATRLEVPSERVISNLANYGNTSAASIPLALDEAVRSGKVQAGHVIAAAGFGAGLTWGSAILRWR